MSPRVTGAVALRVLAQLRRDHRTLAMMLVLPCLLVALLSWMYSDLPAAVGGFDRLGPALLALVPFVVMFLVTSVTTLRERTSGTLERLLALPMGRLDFLLGYLLAFGLVAVAQSAAAVLVCVGLLGLDVAGPVWLLLVVAVADAVLGTALGLLVSAFARTEFQAVQFMPALVIPQLLLCGLFVPREDLPRVLGAVADVLPLSYAVDAMQATARSASPSVGGDVAVVAAYAVGAVALGALTLRRQTR
ncbi:ABC-2 type transport system permease protein [Nocardioides scoriae]|uniref:Transport permease protein n=1 Tax=Nocardioides scoriae TaxID=642780 RepID=A0A1H1TVN2_9ACTN|nr:ABC transporter permease [Nocardioides scoriae]SDS64204.1 ABC-2 type transport system permease protein [Nocardioides scoriae]